MNYPVLNLLTIVVETNWQIISWRIWCNRSLNLIWTCIYLIGAVRPNSFCDFHLYHYVSPLPSEDIVFYFLSVCLSQNLVNVSSVYVLLDRLETLCKASLPFVNIRTYCEDRTKSFDHLTFSSRRLPMWKLRTLYSIILLLEICLTTVPYFAVAGTHI